ncbi:YbaB/EbfC family nucleoid-associated protein [Nocardia sp. IFM 10818]
MAWERSRGEADSYVEGFTEQIRALAETTRKRAQLTGSGSAANGLITVTVNADNVVIATKVSADAEDLTLDEIAAAVTAAAQHAAADVARKTEEFFRPLNEKRAKMPKLSELFEDMPDLEQVPLPKPSLAPPNSRERLEQEAEPGPEFTDAVDHDDWQSDQGSGIRAKDW